jgi:hypothetical protein
MKKKDAIKSLGNEDKLIVQKSLPLFALWRSDLTLAEYKILDTYLSRIDSHKPDKRVVQFEKGELEKILQVKKINNQQLKERLKHLMGNVVTIPDADEKKGFRLITLFEEAVAEQDEYGLWQVRLECTQKAMKYIFNIEHLGYLRYKLRCITSISSKYTYIMFTYLEANRFRMSWEVPVATLKEILNCEKEETYKEFKRFNDRLLKRVQKEMHEKTECHYTYTPVKRGRSVVAVRFELEPLSPQIEPDSTPPIDTPLPDDDYSMQMDFYRDACRLGTQDPEFSAEQIEVLLSIIYTLPDNKLPSNDMGIEFRRYDYIHQKYALMCAYAAKNPIKNRFSYLKKIIEKDAVSQ